MPAGDGDDKKYVVSILQLLLLIVLFVMIGLIRYF